MCIVVNCVQSDKNSSAVCLSIQIHSKNSVDPKIKVPAVSMPSADNDAQGKERVFCVRQNIRDHAKCDTIN